MAPRPIFATGNSDGDLQMLQWTTVSTRPGFCLCIHHTDVECEWAYDRESHVSKLDEAPKRGWSIASMKESWKTVCPE